jgi:predicted ATP-grasp superfamily ATP-dependent carboligase
MARAIVTYSRGWQALAVTRSLGRQGIDVYCGEEAPFAPCFFSRYCKGHFRYPSFAGDPTAFIDFLAEKVRELKPPGDEPYVLMPVHKETWLLAKHRERFEPHIRLPVTSVEKMAEVHDKGRLAVLAEKLDILMPKTLLFRNIDDVYRAVPDLSFPVFLKVREGASGVGIKKCKTPEELTTWFRKFVEGYKLEPESYPLIQEGIDGEDHCVTVLFDHGRCVAKMTYRNVRSFPRETGASALRESVPLPDGEEAAIKLLSHMEWHGIAEVDFRKGTDGRAYLIEVNPRFFGGLPQAMAANVDYPHLLYRIACGETITDPVPVDYRARTETPVTGWLATLDEIARDPELLGRVDRVRQEIEDLGRSGKHDIRLRPFWDAIKEAANPTDIRAFLKEKFEVHHGTIDDILQSDDPRPVLGILYPLALMLKHGNISMGLLTSEAQLDEQRPRRSFRAQIMKPRWRTLGLTVVLFAVALLLANWEPTRNNIGLVLGWPSRLAARLFGQVQDAGTVLGALGGALYGALDLLFLYVCAALILRERKGREEA